MTYWTILTTENLNSYDFTLPNSFFANGQTSLTTTTWGLFAGDADNSQSIDGIDKMLWNNQNGLFNQYNPVDFNMNGSVDGFDAILWSRNSGSFVVVPSCP